MSVVQVSKNKLSLTGFLPLCLMARACRPAFVLHMAGLWQPCVEQSFGATFPTAFAHGVSLGHILVIQHFRLCRYYYGDP